MAIKLLSMFIELRDKGHQYSVTSNPEDKDYFISERRIKTMVIFLTMMYTVVNKKSSINAGYRSRNAT